MNNPLEQYVEEVSRRLRDLSETRRTEEITEIRQHLEASVKAYKELGIDETAATEEAVRQFGAARQVSGGLRKAYWREQIFIPDTLWGAALLVVFVSPLLGMVFGQFLQVFTIGLGFHQDTHSLSGWMVWAFLSSPTIAAGYLVGRLAPQHGFKGVVVGKSLMAVYSMTMYLMMWALANYRQPDWTLAGKSLWDILAMTVLIVPLCAAGAYFGSRHAKETLTPA